MDMNQIMDIDSELISVEVLAERAKVLIDDVSNSFFGWDIAKASEAWRVAPEYYRIADVKTGIANQILFDLMEQLKVLRTVIDGACSCDIAARNKNQ